ncbi:MAG: putative phage integrase [Gammaproteobacteria bacterium]|jgi:integrase|nr:putative phage integrase [Gammaproteobacteria bacterium]
MALYKRGNIWWIRVSHRGKRIQQTTGTEDKIAAQQYHDKFKAELWKVEKLKEKPKKTWKDAVVKWFSEMQHKRSLYDDRLHIKWLDKYLGDFYLIDITKDIVDEIARAREAEGVKPATVNRMMALVRAILRKAVNEWEWIDKVPLVRMRKVESKRIRWITREEALRLLAVLPPHLSAMTAFSLATGLRQSNVTGLRWQDVDLIRQHALIHPDQAKMKKAIPVPLNEDAMDVLRSQVGKHPEYVFTYQSNRIIQCSTKAWRAALKRAGITNFRWHDLRHTWASWHVQSGTSLQELQVLGGWASFDMVLRYAHLSSDHLRAAAKRVSVLKLRNATLKFIGNEPIPQESASLRP